MNYLKTSMRYLIGLEARIKRSRRESEGELRVEKIYIDEYYIDVSYPINWLQ